MMVDFLDITKEKIIRKRKKKYKHTSLYEKRHKLTPDPNNSIPEAGEIVSQAVGGVSDILDLTYLEDPSTPHHFVLPRIPVHIQAKSVETGLRVAINYLRGVSAPSYSFLYLQTPPARKEFPKYTINPWINEWVPTTRATTFEYKAMYDVKKLEKFVNLAKWHNFCKANDFVPETYPPGIVQVLEDLFIINSLNLESQHEFQRGMDVLVNEIVHALVGFNAVFWLLRDTFERFPEAQDLALSDKKRRDALANAEAFLAKYWTDQRYFNPKRKSKFRAHRQTNIPGMGIPLTETGAGDDLPPEKNVIKHDPR